MGINTVYGCHIAHRTANNSMSINFDSVFTANFRRYRLTARAVLLTAENAALDLTLGTGGVDDTGASDYKYAHHIVASNFSGASATYTKYGDAAHTAISLLGDAGAEIDAGSFIEFDVIIDQPFTASLKTRFSYELTMSWNDAADVVRRHSGAGLFNASAKSHSDILISIGTSFASGEFAMYGLR